MSATRGDDNGIPKHTNWPVDYLLHLETQNQIILCWPDGGYWCFSFCFFFCCTSEINSWFCFFNFCYIMLNLSFVGHCIAEFATASLWSFCVSQGTIQCYNDITQTCNVDMGSCLVHCLDSSIGFLIISWVQFMHAALSGSKENICIHVCKSRDLS